MNEENKVVSEEAVLSPQEETINEMVNNTNLDAKQKETVKEVLAEAEVKDIKDDYIRANTAMGITNMLKEAYTAGTNVGSQELPQTTIVSMLRRNIPMEISNHLVGVQPVSQPNSLIFAIRAHALNASGDAVTPDNATWAEAGKAASELLYDAVDTTLSGKGTDTMSGGDYASMTTGTGLTTAELEALGAGDFGQVGITVEKRPVDITSGRALKTKWSVELQQDMYNVHGKNVETEITKFVGDEIRMEKDREIIAKVRIAAKLGSASLLYDAATGQPLDTSNTGGDTAGDGVFDRGAAGVFNIHTMSNGRWSGEDYKSLLLKIRQESNNVARDTRRGAGNVTVVSSNVASIMGIAGMLDYDALAGTKMTGAVAGAKLAGMMGDMKVVVDPLLAYDEFVVGYKGANPWDAGIVHCSYIPLFAVKTVGEEDGQPRKIFKMRAETVATPFTTLTRNSNIYYRKVKVEELL